MQVDPEHRSRNVQDRRGSARGGVDAGFASLVLRFASRFGWKGTVAGVVFLGGVWLVSSLTSSPGRPEDLAYVGTVLDDLQEFWGRTLPNYPEAQLVVFRDSTPTKCGFGSAATGPFYCPLDGLVYLDLSFFDELARLSGDGGDFAAAYVLAHEIGHHVQHLRGRLPKDKGPNGGAVRVELQADCYAGVWAHDALARGRLDPGDPEEALEAASAIGDDRLQRQSTGHVAPESFTHGTAEQRSRWLRKGMTSGNYADCDTFATREL